MSRERDLRGGDLRTGGMVVAERAAPDLVRGLVDEHPMARMAAEIGLRRGALAVLVRRRLRDRVPLYVDGRFLVA